MTYRAEELGQEVGDWATGPPTREKDPKLDPQDPLLRTKVQVQESRLSFQAE